MTKWEIPKQTHYYFKYNNANKKLPLGQISKFKICSLWGFTLEVDEMKELKGISYESVKTFLSQDNITIMDNKDNAISLDELFKLIDENSKDGKDEITFCVICKNDCDVYWHKLK